MINKFNKKTAWISAIFTVLICVAVSGGVWGYKKYFTKHDVCVVYSTDNNYIYYTLVSMESATQNADNRTFYKFTILLSDDVTQDSKEKLRCFDNDNKNCSVSLIDMGDKYDNSQVGGWSKAMYYRLNLPNLLPDEKKCIYLDGDTMVRKDLYEMYSIDMNDYYIAGVRDMNDSVYEGSDYYKTLGIDNLNTYVCSGVLIMNLEKLRNDNMVSKMCEIIEQNDKDGKFKYPDQDVLNKTCFGHILTLPFKYGALITIKYWGYFNADDYIKWASNEKDWEEGDDPVIVHFTALKPWTPERGTTKYNSEWNSIAQKVELKYNF